MAITWGDAQGDELGLDPSWSSDAAGAAVLGFERWHSTALTDSWVEYVVTPPGGPVQLAARRPAPAERCRVLLKASIPGRAALVYSTFEDDDDGLALLEPAGPRLVFRDKGPVHASWYMSPGFLIRHASSTYVRHDPDFAVEEYVYRASDFGLTPSGHPSAVGDDLVFTAGDYNEIAIFAFTAGAGSRPLERFPGDRTRGASNAGADRDWIVWTRGEDRPEGEPVYPTRSVMVAPFTTDPALLVPRRLRTDPDGAIGDPWVVGCGHAARDGTPHQIQIVRIDDGRSWRLVDGPGIEWQSAIGITCEHVYVLVSQEGRFTIARIALDSLGEGSAPD